MKTILFSMVFVALGAVAATPKTIAPKAKPKLKNCDILAEELAKQIVDRCRALCKENPNFRECAISCVEQEVESVQIEQGVDCE